ncbi:hypothetical protein CEE37_07790 [candidate division LCP-89 bacterium B3_LCP]|uniref:S-adenosyl-l-methionine hydroxide adenosyltransferase n=1 Tax=candidate division LCP-89 bacterium B3_LCP TaxID=2012998 RepID=A0A532V0V7_UNCL8|nr:MAG: hypothetical protein CEE37_07790 [candidate division LCP-89 bacterium B3_LCP]
MASRLITLTTDFGLVDSYVAAMKGVILSISPGCQIIDISHDIEPQNIQQAGFVLASVVGYYPEGTIHVAVVDPGVGTARALLAVEMDGHIYLAPDNGLLGVLYEKRSISKICKIENKSLYMPDVSRTFHGRDILAPVAGHLANGLPLDEVGSEVTKYNKGDFVHPIISPDAIRGSIVYRDHFGNLMTNISKNDLESFDPVLVEVQTGYTKIKGLCQSYSDVEKGELLCLIGSAGYLEIAQREGSASDKLRFPIGTEVEVTLKASS